MTLIPRAREVPHIQAVFSAHFLYVCAYATTSQCIFSVLFYNGMLWLLCSFFFEALLEVVNLSALLFSLGLMKSRSL